MHTPPSDRAISHAASVQSHPSGITSVLPWEYAAQVSLCEKRGCPQFPGAPDAPGVYWLEIGEFVYIGEASSLRRRLGDYRNPTDDFGENYRQNLIKEAGGAKLFYFVVQAKPERLRCERQAMEEARGAGIKLLNRGAIRRK